jgi:hypothetical protein
MKTCEKWIACGLAVGFLALLFLVLQNPEIPFPSLTAKQKQNLLYPLGFKEIFLVVQSIKM